MKFPLKKYFIYVICDDLEKNAACGDNSGLDYFFMIIIKAKVVHILNIVI